MPRPSDFDLFWKDRMAESRRRRGLDYAIETASVADAATCQLFDLWYTGMWRAPAPSTLNPSRTSPCHWYFSSMGIRVQAAAGLSRRRLRAWAWHSSPSTAPAKEVPPRTLVDLRAQRFAGHIVAGIDGDPANPLLCPLTPRYSHPVPHRSRARGHRSARVFVNGASQGGGLGIATCALNNELINRAAILYPFLSDFRLVWDLDADDIAYEGPALLVSLV